VCLGDGDGPSHDSITRGHEGARTVALVWHDIHDETSCYPGQHASNYSSQASASVYQSDRVFPQPTIWVVFSITAVQLAPLTACRLNSW
jgi:hypothetical protein